MPRGPADRPIRGTGEEAALQSAARRALEQGAAPVAAGRAAEPDPPASGARVAETEPVRAASGVTRTLGARSFVLSKARRKERKEFPASRPAPDPLGRGGRVDVRR